MPLRRSKSLNDKVTRQKHRSSDVVRDPRCPDAGGAGAGGGGGGGAGGRSRTRTCLDNYQLLVHLKKQTDDKSRQLELAYTYGGNAPSFLRPGAAQRASAHRPLSEFHPSPSFVFESGPAGAAAQSHRPGSPRPAAAGGHHRQHSADGCSRQEPGRAVKRQESISEGQLGRGSLQPGQRCPRPMSMFEQRTCTPLPTKEDWVRKTQVIQNLMENQKCVDGHNRLLRSKIDELELENAHLKEILNAHNIPHVTLPGASKLRPHQGAHDLIHSPVSEAFPKLSSALLSPMSDTSVSGYGSLAGSAYDEGYMATLEAGGGGGGGKGRKAGEEEMGPTAEAGGCYNDDTLPLSEMSVERVGSADSSLPSTLSSGGKSRVPTTNREAGKDDLQSIHEKLDQVLDLERHRGGDGKRRVVELERLVVELTEQRNSVLEGYRHIVEEHRKLQAREEHVQEELRALLQQHGQTLQHVLRQELQQLQQELQGLGQDVRGQLDLVLASLASSSSCSSSYCVGRDRRDGCGGPMDPDVRVVVDKVVDLIGPEYLRLGRRLNVPPLQLEKIEEGREDFAHKTKKVLQTWLRRHREDGGQGESSGVNAPPPPAQVLTRALRDIDKDVRLFNHDPISTPERQALRNCLQVAIDHVTDVSDLLDYLIMLNVLSPAGITFVQEVVEESAERALCRLWHVTEYRGSGVLSRVALALERAGYPHVSRRLTDELEIQNSRLHAHHHHRHHHHPLSDDLDPPVATQAAQNLGSRPSPSSPASRSRPSTIFEAVGLPERPLGKSDKTGTSSLSRQDDGGRVWNRRVPGQGGASKGASPGPVVPEQRGTMVSRV